MRVQTSFLDTGSIPVVGSSMNIILGSPIALIATDNLLFIPPEKDIVLACLTSYKPTAFKSSSQVDGISG